MENKSLDEITDEVLKLYEEGKATQEIAKMCAIPEYLVQSILIQTKDIIFR